MALRKGGTTLEEDSAAEAQLSLLSPVCFTIIVDFPHNVLTYNLKHSELVVPSRLFRTAYCMQQHVRQDLRSSNPG